MSSSALIDVWYLITGASGGIGFETAHSLASTGRCVIVTARSQAKADDAVRRLQQRRPSQRLRLLALPLDLCDLHSIEALCTQLEDRQLLLHCVICNAGAGGPSLRGKAYDLPALWVNNFLGHYHLVRLLLPQLQKAARQTPDCSRVIHVSSVMHRASNNAALFTDIEGRGHSGLTLYSHTKYAQVLFSFELHRRYFTHPAGSVASVAVNPGAVNSEIWRYIPPPLSWLSSVVFRILFLDCEQGSRTSVYAATLPVEEGRLDYVTPYLTSDWRWLAGKLDVWWITASPRLTPANEDAYSTDAADRLWRLSEQQIKRIRGIETTPYQVNDD